MNSLSRATVIGHLAELRARLLRSALYAVAGTTAAWCAFDPLYSFVMRPLRGPLLRLSGALTVRGLLDGFLIKSEIALAAGLVLAAPLILCEAWAFIAPGLTVRERSAARLLAPASGALFAGGVALGYAITGPSVRWLLQFVPPEAQVLLTLSDTVLLILKLYLAFGLGFQMPVVLVLLAAFGVISSRLLWRRWREATVLIFVVAAIITPTWDPFTMTICALPMCLLYLSTCAVIHLMESRRRSRSRATQASVAS